MSERKKVLVIEDDVETAKYHAQRLYLFGFDCDLAYDGRTALDMLRTREYELALVDIRLPDVSGLELLNIIRSERIRIFAIAVSGFGEPSDRIQGLDAGTDDYMVKPVDYQELLSRYNALLRRDPQKTLFYQIRGIQAFATDEQARINCKLDAIFACVSTSQKTMTALRAASDVLKSSLADGIRRIVKSINARNIDGLDIIGPRTTECKEQVLAVVSWLANPKHPQNVHHAWDRTFRPIMNGYKDQDSLFSRSAIAPRSADMQPDARADEPTDQPSQNRRAIAHHFRSPLFYRSPRGVPTNSRACRNRHTLQNRRAPPLKPYHKYQALLAPHRSFQSDQFRPL